MKEDLKKQLEEVERRLNNLIFMGIASDAVQDQVGFYEDEVERIKGLLQKIDE